MHIEHNNQKSVILDGAELRFTHSIRNYEVISQIAIMLIASWLSRTSQEETATIELPDTRRNVVAFDDTERPKWFISLPDGCNDDEFYREVFIIKENILARHDSGQFYVVDQTTGNLLWSFPRDQLLIGEELVTVDGDVSEVVELDGRVFVGTRGTNNLYGFDCNGDELWRSDPDTRRGYIHVEDGELREIVGVSKGIEDHHQIDPSSGERIATSRYEVYE